MMILPRDGRRVRKCTLNAFSASEAAAFRWEEF
jgi:hypothetical protein